MQRRRMLEVLGAVKLPVRREVAVAAGGAVLAAVGLFAACGACGRATTSTPAGGAAAARQGDGEGTASGREGEGNARAAHEDRRWALAKDGEDEDLATLAVYEGALGLVEGASDPDLRATAIRAMAFARGWAQVPYLATIAGGKDEGDAKLALASLGALGVRPRASEDAEDAAELAEGCALLVTLARASDRDRGRRVGAIRAVRSMPCPPAELPAELDAK